MRLLWNEWEDCENKGSMGGEVDYSMVVRAGDDKGSGRVNGTRWKSTRQPCGACVDGQDREGHRTEFRPGSLQMAFLPVVVIITEEKPVWGSEQEKSSLEIRDMCTRQFDQLSQPAEAAVFRQFT